ncbi:MAG TPA: hypothetical protein VJ841_02240 [Candidatus Saccharimonadales bacterium]|nr:hypothetical protein [Candidatus Saccharimonadales bacterium]
MQIRPDIQVQKADAEKPHAVEQVKEPPTEVITDKTEPIQEVAKINPPQPEPSPEQPIIVAEADGPEQWMDAAGIAGEDRQYVQQIMGQESGWTLDSVNSIGCIGLGQACPGGNKAEMLEKCPDWQANGSCQMKVWTDYMLRRYGSWSYAAQWKFCTGVCYNEHLGVSVDKRGEPWW